MDHYHSITGQHVKGKHLTFEERVIIQTRHKDGWSANRIAKELGCAPNTIRNELRRCTVILHHGKIQRYKASQGQKAYEQNRTNCCRHYERLEKAAFLQYVDHHVREDGWSLDACRGRALRDKIFRKDEVTCTKTLYNYVNLGLMENKKKLGRSIEERDPSVNDRKEFRHWESDLVIGQNSGKDNVLLTLAEHKSREYWMIPLVNREADTILEAFEAIRKE
ncbi:MAG: helix-turn-helix domain-containing protein [Eubacterium sp.]|jgi:IS30 family transposase|nr:helix-turn-helix domain-containing protein [Eubacterium sp.]MCH4045867.1 helix-turn-helix domain-containing protein [Eubacterium sp.]MCH4078960.1 helix-turn-helix domain-containing protein [Eubacterium sp.]